MAAEIGCSPRTVRRDLDEWAAYLRAENADLAANIRNREDARLLAIIDHAWHIVDRLTDIDTNRGPIDYKAAQALATILRASESRRRLWGADAPTRMAMGFDTMTEEEAAAILAEEVPDIPA